MIYHLVVGGMCVILYIFYSSNMSNGLLGFASDVSDYLLDRRSDSLLVYGRDASGAIIGCWLRD